MGKRQVPSSHPGNRGKTQHDWPDRLGNSRKETAWPLCRGFGATAPGRGTRKGLGLVPSYLLTQELTDPLVVFTETLLRARSC